MRGVRLARAARRQRAEAQPRRSSCRSFSVSDVISVAGIESHDFGSASALQHSALLQTVPAAKQPCTNSAMRRYELRTRYQRLHPLHKLAFCAQGNVLADARLYDKFHRVSQEHHAKAQLLLRHELPDAG